MIKKKKLIGGIQDCINDYVYFGRTWSGMLSDLVAYKNRYKTKHETFNIGGDQGSYWIDGEQLVIVIQGSYSGEPGNTDWWGIRGNFNFSFSKVPHTKKIHTDVRVHAGHLAAWKNIKPTILKLCRKRGVKKIRIVGHSRGAAIGQIAAENIKFLFSEKEVAYLGYAPSRVGNQAWTDLFERRGISYSICWCAADPVPRIPLKIQGYQHLEKKVILKPTGFLPTVLGWMTPVVPWPNDHRPGLIRKTIKERL